MVSVRDAAAYVGFSTDTIRSRIKDGSLPAYRFGPRNLRIDLADLDALFNRVPARKSAR